MNEADFDQRAEDTMLAIEEAIDECGVDIDYDNADGILTLEFDNASRIIINKQAPLAQLWVAARSGGYHFYYDSDDACWRLQGSDEELFSCLGRYCSEQAGSAVRLGR
jgi:CyaY protein